MTTQSPNKGGNNDDLEGRSALLRRAFATACSEPVQSWELISPQGSNRFMIRLRGNSTSAIGVVHDNPGDHTAYISLARHFRAHGLRVPEIIAEPLAGHVLVSDLGESTLFDRLVSCLQSNTPPSTLIPLYEDALKALLRFQIEAGTSVNFELCYPARQFDAQNMISDMHLFATQYLARTTLDWNNDDLEHDFRELARFLDKAPSSYFMYRDFQSRNIVLNDFGELGYVDFQGGRRGPLQYDVVSLLYQSRANLSEQVRSHLLNTYLERLETEYAIDREEFIEFFDGFVLIRLLQVLGCYAKLGFEDGKVFFVESIPYAIDNLQRVRAQNRFSLPLPHLNRLLDALPHVTKLSPAPRQKVLGTAREPR